MRAVAQQDIELLRSSGHFDPDWYRATYPDVALLGMDPAEHYLEYGFRMNRDPGPDFSTAFHRMALRELKPEAEPVTVLARRKKEASENASPYNEKAVLVAAYRDSRSGNHARAIALAERHLPFNLRHTAHILRANAAIAARREADWLAALNAYLQHFDTAPLVLEGTGPLLDRLATAPLPAVTGGPLVTVIMPAWNAEATVRTAARSVLNQTWQNLELLIVDDCSSDGTWNVLQEIAASDDRVRIFRNAANVGPYVSKNIALRESRGAWITGHDADDWAHPQRIERHLAAALQTSARASLTYMIRVQTNGHFDTFARVSDFSPDGVTRISSISNLLRRDFLAETLGFWDSVRFGADSEMIARARLFAGNEFRNFRHIGMICLSMPTGLTNHREFGIHGASGLSPVRTRYKTSWSEWHKTLKTSGRAYVGFPLESRPFPAPREMAVSFEDSCACSSPEASRKLA